MRKKCKISAGQSSKTQRGESPFFHAISQSPLHINPTNDPFEHEADAMSNKVIDNSTSLQSLSNANNGIQRSESNGGSLSNSSSVSDSLQSGGQPMDDMTRSFMEQQFSYDFSKVRIHNDATAHQSSTDINANAYTQGKDIVFASGKYQPNTDDGKKLLAHELTHVVQQRNSSKTSIQRSVADTSVCTRTRANGAPPSPIIMLILADAMAGMHITQARLALKLDLMNSTGVPSGKGFDAYKSRFGVPAKVGNRFRNRFNGTVHDSLAKAQASEMGTLDARLARVEKLLEQDIRYICAAPSAGVIVGNCFLNCRNGDFLETCPTGGNTIVVCPPFWGSANPAQKGIGIIHECVHILFGFGDHDTSPFAQSFSERNTEPECYASMVADINNVVPFDPSCPAVP